MGHTAFDVTRCNNCGPSSEHNRLQLYMFLNIGVNNCSHTFLISFNGFLEPPTLWHLLKGTLCWIIESNLFVNQGVDFHGISERIPQPHHGVLLQDRISFNSQHTIRERQAPRWCVALLLAIGGINQDIAQDFFFSTVYPGPCKGRFSDESLNHCLLLESSRARGTLSDLQNRIIHRFQFG